MLTTCSEPGCATLVMGGRCLEHERPSTRVFVRGRPLVVGPSPTSGSGYGKGVATFAASGLVRSLDVSAGVHAGIERSRN